MSDTTDKILVEVENGIVTVTLNRPDKHNALDAAMRERLVACFVEAGEDPGNRAMILRGRGRSFCSGQDIQETKAPVLSKRASLWQKEQENLGRILGELPFPVIAALHGNVIGRGLDLALAADIRVVAQNARLRYPEVAHGMVLSGGGMRRLARLIGESRASEIMLCGSWIDADTAISWGLATRKAAEDDLDETVMDLAATLADRAPLAMYMAKTSVRHAFEASAASGAVIDTALNVLGLKDTP